MVSRTRSGPSSSLNGFVRDVPRIVPPRGRIPRVDSIVELVDSASSTPLPPVAEADDRLPVTSMPLRTIARITALSPGQSPPPVSTPMRTVASSRHRFRRDAPQLGYLVEV